MSAPRTLTFFGGAATATGSMILLEAAGARVLLDAGLFEGAVGTTALKNRDLPLDPARVDAVLLSQAGITSAGRVPQLVHHGFRGPIYATPGTRNLAAVTLAEAAMAFAETGDPEPLFTLQDVVRTQSQMVGQPYHRPVHLRRNLVFEFADAGHILGSSSIELRTGEGGSHRILYSGSLGRPSSPILRDAESLPGEVDTLIIGGPFAHAQHPMFVDAYARLANIITETIARGGQIIVPAATLGPAHEFVRAVQKMWRRGQIPELPIWLDTPTPVCLGTIMRMHPEALARLDRAYRGHGGAFDNALIQLGSQGGGRERLDALTEPAIIVAPSEMGDTGRAAHHLVRCLPDARHTVILLAFQEEDSVGERLQRGDPEVTIGESTVPVRAHVESMPAFSGHADSEELRSWIRALQGPIRRAFVVQGDDLAVAMMVTILREEGVRDVIVPREGEAFPF